MTKEAALLKISQRLRKRRFARFMSELRPRQTDSILDVGGLPTMWIGTGFEHNVTLINLNVPESPSPFFQWVRGDACSMAMFQAKAFDIVFSNSVIEHVGDFSRQRQMASEVERIGKKIWIQTPCKHFPLEPHFMFPFFQYFPLPLRLGIARRWAFSFSRQCGLDPDYEAKHIWPLSRRDMRRLFPGARILTETLFGLPKSIMAVKP
ncbi:MAG: class I SAM-dependent methyltransferase [Lentisphaerae bacterium]|nr:class I SAM-dependent methyltransferase [Lentisphaerota bacterium]